MPARTTSHALETNYGRTLEALSLVLGFSYLAALPVSPYPGSPAIKGLSIAILAVLPWLSRTRRRDAALLSAALVASATGDVLLEAGPERLFVPGLSAFLTAHIAYTVLFAGNRATGAGLSRCLWLAAVLVYVALFSLWLAPSLGPLKIPVMIYICAIAAMTSTALLSRFGQRVAAGALLFLVSDSLLAIGKFKAPFLWLGYMVWTAYYAAQYLIATGVCHVSKD